MEKVISALKEIEEINERYEISPDDICKMREEILNAKVCTPIIGKFSSGKSALVNTLLGYSRKILREDITPETAIPAEIVYADAEDGVRILHNDGTCEVLGIEEYRKYEANANTVKSARVQLHNSFLEKIPDVMLVDMPGFESGFEIHNKAIDNYLPQSLAYIVAFPADDMIVRNSVGSILKELCLHDMPLCVVITKYDKKNDDFEETFEKMKESLKRFVGDRAITYCRTSSFTGDAEELEEFLEEIQDRAQDILENKYKKMVLPIAENTEHYLVTRLNGSTLSESELTEKEEKLERQLSELDSKFAKEKQDFERETAECAEEIKTDVQNAVEAEETRLVAMMLNGQNINEHLNTVVRNAVTVSVKKRFLPKVEKYLKKVEDTVNSVQAGECSGHFFGSTIGLSSDSLIGSIVAVAAGFLLGTPIIGIIAGIVGALMKFSKDKKREEAKQAIRQRLRTEIFPQVLSEVGNGVEKQIAKEVSKVNEAIEADLENQKTILKKAISDLKQQISDENTKKESLAAAMREDLSKIEEIKDGLR